MSLKKFQEIYPSKVKQLFEAKLQGKIFHSCIFSGDNLTNLSKFVYGWIQICVCENPTEEGDACGLCSHCRQIGKSKYPYLTKIEPTSKSRHILVDEIRNLEKSLYLTSEGNIKIGLIFEADRLVAQAQNAFLKTLEEPPADTLLLLVTMNYDALIPTIRSRCQHISLFNNRYNYDFPEIEKLLHSLGSMGRGKGAMVAISAAHQIMEILGTLKRDAEEITQTKSQTNQYYLPAEDKSIKKKIESRKSAQTSSKYLSYRDQLLSAIHAWYSQEFMRANEVPIESLPYPEFYKGMPLVLKEAKADKTSALRNLQLADTLIRNSRFNVSEQLMIQDFCHKVCEKSAISH